VKVVNIQNRLTYFADAPENHHLAEMVRKQREHKNFPKKDSQPGKSSAKPECAKEPVKKDAAPKIWTNSLVFKQIRSNNQQSKPVNQQPPPWIQTQNPTSVKNFHLLSETEKRSYPPGNEFEPNHKRFKPFHQKQSFSYESDTTNSSHYSQQSCRSPSSNQLNDSNSYVNFP
jgi:hypothetical protein